MAFERRHIEFFGTDLGRGPVLSGAPEVAAVQVAAALAQLRTPLLRSDSDLEAHTLFIRSLADKLFPDLASSITLEVGGEVADAISTNFIDNSGAYSLLHCWLADAKGGGETVLAPDSVTWSGNAVVLATLTTRKRYMIVTPTSGVISASISYTGDYTWYWAVERNGRVVYSNALNFAL